MKEDSCSSDLTAEKAPLGLHKEESSNSNISPNNVNVNAENGVAVEYKKEDLPQVNPQLYKRLAIINGKSSFDNSIAQSSENVNIKNSAATVQLQNIKNQQLSQQLLMYLL